MTPEEEARQQIDEKLRNAGWIVQSMKELNIYAGRGVIVREFPTDTGPVDYAIFVDGVPVGVIEAKPDLLLNSEQVIAVAMATFRLSAVSLFALKFGMSSRWVMSSLTAGEMPLPSLPMMMMPSVLNSCW